MAERLSEPYGSSFGRIYHRMRQNAGDKFGQVFREEMQRCLKGLPITEEDKSQFLSLFDHKGYEDELMQIRTIEQSMELLQHTIGQLERENREKCRMAVGLGAMSGLLLLVVLF